MTHPTANSAFLSLLLEPDSPVPLYQQLYNSLRQAILSGQLAANTRLPATRVLARNLNISRSTVIIAFEQLLYEGYIRGKVGSGTYVEAILPEQLLHSHLSSPNVPPSHQQAASQTTITTAHHRLSQRGQIIAHSSVAPALNWQEVNLQQPFRHGIPALNEFPFKIWTKLAARHWRHASSSHFAYSDPAGFYPLRREIAAYLQAARGVHCNAEQIIIVAGSQQALSLAGHLLLDSGDPVWIEDPCYLGARGALLSSGAHLIPVPVDYEGLIVNEGIRLQPQARLAYVTPSHQFPSGTTMSLTRRLALLHWAQQTDAWILEDDYDGEYRYAGHPLASLQGLDTTERVLYIGTFSKVLFPALRLGYLVVPHTLTASFSAARAAFDRQSPVLDQMILTDFFLEEHFARHVRRMRALYEERQGILMHALEQELGGLMTIQSNEAGMHLIALLPESRSATAVARQAATHDVALTPLAHYYFGQGPLNALIFGYAAFSEQEIRSGVQKLARSLQT